MRLSKQRVAVASLDSSEASSSVVGSCWELTRRRWRRRRRKRLTVFLAEENSKFFSLVSVIVGVFTRN